MRGTMKLAVAGLLALLASTGCTNEGPHVEGQVRLATSRVPALEPWLVVRAVPDHPDGFDPHRVYHGDEEFIDAFAVDEIDFPHAFHLHGPEPRTQGKPWLLLAWLTDDPHAEWIQPGQSFGAVRFEIVHVPHAPSYAEDLEVTLDQLAPR